MALQKKDFIEIEFTGKLKDTGEVFDSNAKEELEKLHQGHNHAINAKPLIYCLGEGMFLEGIDNNLIGKEIGKHKIELKPEDAFGKRQQELIKMIPAKIFIQHKINPVKGAVLNFDGRPGKVISVSGGRALIDFNHPLAGKEVSYEINVKRIVSDVNEKINAFNELIFRKEIKFLINEKDKKIIYNIPEKEKALKAFVEMFREKFKEIFGFELEVTEIKEKGEEII